MAVASGRSNRFTSSLSDYYPLKQFEQLSHRAFEKKRKHNNTPVSPREEIYLSLLKDIRSNRETSKLGVQVKKASGILRLSHLHQNQERLDNSASDSKSSSAVNRHKLHNDPMGSSLKRPGNQMASIDMRSSEMVSKLAANGGDFSQIWDYVEGSALNSSVKFKTTSRPPSRRSNISNTSTTSRASYSSHVDGQKPPWRYFGNQKGLSVASKTSNSSLVTSLLKSSSSSVATLLNSSSASINSKSKGTGTVTSESRGDKKADYMKHVFVINGQVLTFKGQGFETFSNWFGDVALLSKCDGSRTPRLRREFNLSGFSNQEIRMKLYEGYKLVIEAQRMTRDKRPPLRFKETIVLPKGISVEDLVICRYESGRLVVLDKSNA